MAPAGGTFQSALIGSSGTVSNLVYVTPFLMSVLPSRVMRIMPPRSLPWSRNTTSGNAAPPWDTRIAGPARGTRAAA